MNSINFTPEAFADKLTELLNDETRLAPYGLLATSGSPIARDVNFLFSVHTDTGEYLSPSRIGNTITRYINGELSVISSNLTGSSEENATAVIETRLEFLVPMLSRRKNDNALLAAVRQYISDALRYTNQQYVSINGAIYIQLVSFDFASTGSRTQLPGVGDAISLSLYVTFTYVMQGLASDGVQIYLKSTEDDTWKLIPYNKLGIARKLTAENAVQSGDSYVPISKSLPTSTLLTINIDALARLEEFDTVARDYRLYGTIETLKILIKEITGIDENGKVNYATADYDMILDLATLNAEQNALSSATYTLVERSGVNG